MLSVSGSSVDMTSAVKKPLSFHMDDASLGDVMRKAADMAGIRNMRIDPAFDQIRRDYWLVNRQSLMSLGDRFARELAGTFKFAGDEAALAKRGTGLAPSGLLLPTVVAERGKNLKSARVKPLSLRRVFGSTKVIWFDQKAGQHREIEEAGEEDARDVDAVNVTRLLAASEDQAREQASARNRESAQNRGSGRITIDLDPNAQPEGLAEGRAALASIRDDIGGSGALRANFSKLHCADNRHGAPRQRDAMVGAQRPWTGPARVSLPVFVFKEVSGGIFLTGLLSQSLEAWKTIHFEIPFGIGAGAKAQLFCHFNNL